MNQARRMTVLAAVTLTLLSTIAPPAFSADPAAKCAVSKHKAAGKKLSAKLKCHDKAILKGVAVDAECLAKAESNFNLAFAKAELPGACVTTGDADEIEQIVDDALAALLTALPAVATTTTTTVTTSTTTTLAPICPGCPPVAVVRVGDGAAALTSAATPVFLNMYEADGTLSDTLPMPVAVSGLNQPLTLSGTGSTEGMLSLSEDGQYLTLAGYGATPGTATIASTTSATVNRVVGRIDGLGNVDTTTRLNAAFSGNAVRGATSSDGTSYWVAGTNSSPAGSVFHLATGTTGGTLILTSPGSARAIGVSGGQLYGSSASSSFTNVFTIGTGLPTTSGQTATSLPGMPTTGASPFAFILLDRNPGVPGVDTMYVADDRSVGSGGGIQKWSFNSATWTLETTVTYGSTGFRGLAALESGSDVVLFATTTQSSANNLVIVVDDGSLSLTAQLVATAPVDTVFRGVAPAPE